MSKSVKRAIFIIISFILILFGISVKSNALNSFSALVNSQNYYCLHKDATNINANSSYTLAGDYTITGNTIRNNNTGATATRAINGIIADILCRSRGAAYPHWKQFADGTMHYVTGVSDTAGQNAFWEYSSSWAGNAGIYIPGNFGAPYHSSGWSVSSATMPSAWNNTNESAITVEAYEKNGKELVRVGPFNFGYAEQLDTFIVKGDNGIQITKDNLIFERYVGSSVQTISQPVSNQNFYISFEIPYGMSKITGIYIKSKAQVDTVSFKIWTISGQQDILEKRNPGQTTVYYDIEFKFNIKLLGKIELGKKDTTTGKALANVGFTFQMKSGIKSGQYVGRDGNGNAIYSNSPITVITDSNGAISIDNMWPGECEVIETVNPNYGYQVMNEDIKELPIVIGTYKVNPGGTVEIDVNNYRKWIWLTGYVWEDMISEKGSSRDSKYTSSDKLVANVTVKLKDKNGNDVKFYDSSGKGHTEVLTDSNGKYEMWDILIDNLPNYYIQFSYNGMSYEPVPLTDLLSANSSKAIENAGERTEFNRKYSEITHSNSTGPIGESRDDTGKKIYNLNYDEGEHTSKLNYGQNSVYGYSGQKFPVNKVDAQYMMNATTKEAYQGYLSKIKTPDQIRQGGIECLDNINLGIKEREQPDLALVEDIENVKVILNGYEHTYNYDQRFVNQGQYGDGFNVGVKFANEYGSQEYTQAIYSSDVVYNDIYDDSLGIYVRYKIALRNEGTDVYTRVNEITNYYDSRYTVDKIEDESGKTYSHNSEGSVSGFNKITIDVNQDLASQQTKYVYITYKLQNDAINAVLNDSNEFINDPLDSITEITSYSTYSDSGFSVHYAGVDKDSRPGSAVPNDKATYEDDTDSAPAFKLELREGRVISGTVWEDEAIEELLEKENNAEAKDYKERIGNGLYEQGTENVVQKVKVDLIVLSYDANTEIDLSSANLLGEVTDVNSSEIAKIYTARNEEKEATMETGTDGRYEFSGVIPGQYLLRYTYGNESIIVKPDGSTEEIGDVDKYKSTIYRGDRNGNKTTSQNDTDYWYRAETSGDGAQRWSDARDEIGVNGNKGKYDLLKDRLHNAEKEFYFGNTDYSVISLDERLDYIEARSRGFEIKMDYDVNLDNMSTVGDQLKFVFDNMDFGIIKRPKQRLDVDKQISYVKVTLANGQVVIEGDPRTETIEHLRFLPDGNVHIELDSEIIQGATLTIKYDIIADNTESEVDFNNDDYYIFGIIPNDPNDLVVPRPKRLLDYLSNELAFSQENSPDWTQCEEADLENWYNNKYFSDDVYNKLKTYNQVLQTSAFADMLLERRVVPLEVSKILSNSADDLIFENEIEVNIITGRRTVKNDNEDEYTIPGNYVPGEGGTIKGGDDDYIYLTVTGPTGENLNYIPYIILGFSVLGILGAGILIIKKKVL